MEDYELKHTQIDGVVWIMTKKIDCVRYGVCKRTGYLGQEIWVVLGPCSDEIFHTTDRLHAFDLAEKEVAAHAHFISNYFG